jgi:hypothetical protein
MREEIQAEIPLHPIEGSLARTLWWALIRTLKMFTYISLKLHYNEGSDCIYILKNLLGAIAISGITTIG